jgi:hypothetical protein
MKKISSSNYTARSKSTRETISSEHMDAINTVFTLLAKASFAKYKLAFPTNEAINSAKATWLGLLKNFPPARIVKATKQAIYHTKYFPDLIEIIKQCKFSLEELNLKPALEAYKEACTLEHNDNWSHEVVKLAAKKTGWHTLKSESKYVAFPIFENYYLELVTQMQNGKSITDIIEPKSLDCTSIKEKAKLLAEQQQHKLMQQQKINTTDAITAKKKLLNTFSVNKHHQE